jgi:hypothetical protein
VTTAEPPGVRFELSAGPGDVGHRVVVRRRLAGGGYGDVLGELVRWSDAVVVRDRHGVEQVTAIDEVVAAKRVPPPPARRRSSP